MLGEVNFQSKLRLRASFFFIWKLLFGQKKGWRLWEHLENLVGGAETFSDRSKSQTPCHMAAIDTVHYIEFPWERYYCSMLPRYSVLLHLMVILECVRYVTVGTVKFYYILTFYYNKVPQVPKSIPPTKNINDVCLHDNKNMDSLNEAACKTWQKYKNC